MSSESQVPLVSHHLTGIISTKSNKYMPDHFSIKRRHPRIFFSSNDQINAIISSTETPQASFSGSVLNLSQGGLQLSQKRSEYRGLQAEDTLIIRRIPGFNELIPLADIPAKIVWLMNNQHLNHVIMGIAFTILTGNQVQTLKSFVNTWLALHQE